VPELTRHSVRPIEDEMRAVCGREHPSARKEGHAMNYMLVHHRVQDFEQWKGVYDSHLPMRQQAGVKELHLWHAAEDPNDVTLLFETSDLSKAKAFAESVDLRQTMTKSGVVGKADLMFLKD
jgi:hypothetical protein